jgi:hypothetical protein
MTPDSLFEIHYITDERIAMRACKTDTSFQAMINLAATVIRTR